MTLFTILVTTIMLFSRLRLKPGLTIKAENPKLILARNTICIIQAGLVYGYFGQVKYIVNKLKEELNNPNMKVVATGGLGSIIVPETNAIEEYNMMLTIKGLKYVCKKNI